MGAKTLAKIDKQVFGLLKTIFKNIRRKPIDAVSIFGLRNISIL